MAFSARRTLLQKAGILGLKVIGPRHQPDTNEVREFLFKNFVPHTFYDSEADDGRKELACLKKTDEDTPVIECGPDNVLVKPELIDLAKCAGVRHKCPEGLFDLAVVGAGPAGMTAAVYAASEALSTIVLDRLGPGGQAGGSSMIENFIGFPSGLSGVELAQRGVLQMLKFGAMLNTPVKVTGMEVGDEEHILFTSTGEKVRARVVLAATGVRWKKLEAKGAERFERAGIFYAATAVESRVCVGDEVAVIGGGNSAGQAAMFISECARQVHLLVRSAKFGDGMSEYLVNRITKNPRIKLHTNTEVTEVFGDEERVKEIEVIDNQSKERRRLKIAAMFVFIGAEPHADWLPKEVARSEGRYVLTGVDAERSGKWPLKNRSPCPLETTVPRLLAAGDLRYGSTKRVGFAVGDGSLAVTCVHRLRQED
jgi:thioredoxin reductase (NADPH)